MASKTEREQVRRRGAILEGVLAEARGALRRQARLHSQRESEAEEAMQEAIVDFLRSYEGPAGVDAVRWLQVAVKYRAWGLARAERARMARNGGRWDEGLPRVAAGEADPGDCAERSEAVDQFFNALAQLKPDERVALLLFGLGFSYREIGERQGWTSTKVKRCMAEGRAALRSFAD